MGEGISPAGRRGVVAGVFIAYLAVIALGVFGPAPDDQIHQAGKGARRVAGEIGAIVPGRQREGNAPPEVSDGDRLFGSFRTEAAANVALFVPLGVMFPALFRRWRWWTVPVGMATSVIIEGTQLVFLPWRSPSFGDIAANSVGAVIGFGLWLLVAALWRWRHTSVVQ